MQRVDIEQQDGHEKSSKRLEAKLGSTFDGYKYKLRILGNSGNGSTELLIRPETEAQGKQ